MTLALFAATEELLSPTDSFLLTGSSDWLNLFSSAFFFFLCALRASLMIDFWISIFFSAWPRSSSSSSEEPPAGDGALWVGITPLFLTSTISGDERFGSFG